MGSVKTGNRSLTPFSFFALSQPERSSPLSVFFLDRLKGSAVDLSTDVKPLGVGVDPELDRGVEFSKIELCVGIHRCQVGGSAPA